PAFLSSISHSFLPWCTHVEENPPLRAVCLIVNSETPREKRDRPHGTWNELLVEVSTDTVYAVRGLSTSRSRSRGLSRVGEEETFRPVSHPGKDGEKFSWSRPLSTNSLSVLYEGMWECMISCGSTEKERGGR
ncbi:hypothetical protein CSPX01_06612, partial [Colletotrichum filicis]